MILNKSYTFSDYFELRYSTKDILNELGYSFEFQKLVLPQQNVESGSLKQLEEALYKRLPHISLTSETAKREFLISPLFFALFDYIDFKIDVEYALNVDEKLKGSIDYLLHSKQSLIVVEAKNADLERGFTQLAVELIAMDKHLKTMEDNTNRLYGAVTVGDVWRFGVLDRVNAKVFKNIDTVSVPTDLEELFSILMGILTKP